MQISSCVRSGTSCKCIPDFEFLVLSPRTNLTTYTSSHCKYSLLYSLYDQTQDNQRNILCIQFVRIMNNYKLQQCQQPKQIGNSETAVSHRKDFNIGFYILYSIPLSISISMYYKCESKVVTLVCYAFTQNLLHGFERNCTVIK